MNKQQDVIQMGISGIQCDNKECDYYETGVPFEDYKNWVNKPCPCCGENLLTEADYSTAELLMEGFNVINQLNQKELEEVAAASIAFMDNNPDIIEALGLKDIPENTTKLKIHSDTKGGFIFTGAEDEIESV